MYQAKLREFADQLEYNTIKDKHDIKYFIESLKKGDCVKVNFSYGKDIQGKIQSVMCGLYEIVHHHNYRSTFHYEKIEEISERTDLSKVRFMCRVFIKLETQANPLVLGIDEINTIQKDFTKVQYNAIAKAVDWANLNTDDDDCVWKAINKYKALRDLSEEQQATVYDLIVERLGL